MLTLDSAGSRRSSGPAASAAGTTAPLLLAVVLPLPLPLLPDFFSFFRHPTGFARPATAPAALGAGVAAPPGVAVVVAVGAAISPAKAGRTGGLVPLLVVLNDAFARRGACFRRSFPEIIFGHRFRRSLQKLKSQGKAARDNNFSGR